VEEIELFDEASWSPFMLGVRNVRISERFAFCSVFIPAPEIYGAREKKWTMEKIACGFQWGWPLIIPVLIHMQASKTTPFNTFSPLLTTSEAMAMLRITRATLCSWCRQGLVPHMRMPDGAYRFRGADLEQWLGDRAA
jgi:excisionase family DNA binding protein